MIWQVSQMVWLGPQMPNSLEGSPNGNHLVATWSPLGDHLVWLQLLSLYYVYIAAPSGRNTAAQYQGTPHVKHRKNCECCHHHSLFKGHNAIVHIVVLNCQKCNQCLECHVSGHKTFKNSENIQKLSKIVKKLSKIFKNCQNCQKLSKLSKIG